MVSLYVSYGNTDVSRGYGIILVEAYVNFLSHIVNESISYICNMYWYVWQEVRQLELLCKQLYEATDPATRVQAEKSLVVFQNAPDTLSKCQLLLDRGDSCYAQLLAATTLTKLISRSAQALSLQQRVDISE